MAGTMVLSPAPVLQFLDIDGKPLTGGLLFTYAAGTTTKQDAFTDDTGGTPLPNPIVLNSRGEVSPDGSSASCGLWLDPSLEYKFVLAPATAGDPPTSSFWTIDNVVSPAASVLAAIAQYEATIGGVPIGGQIAYAGASAPNGWLLCYGQQVSRTTYALLFAIIGTTYGSGNGTTTFNLPDKRGRVSIGKDDMGGSAANRVTAAVSGLNGTTQGAAGGDQHAQNDTLNAVSTLVLAVTDSGHLHTMSSPNGVIGGNTGGNPGFGPGALYSPTTSVFNTGTSPTGLSVSGSVSTTVTSALLGGSQNIQPSQIDNWIIFTGVGA